MRKKQKITYQKERAILSDVLPYEIPVIFSNRYFYRFLVENKIEIDQFNEIKYSNKNTTMDEILKLVFNAEVDVTSHKASAKRERNIPFTFKIAHKENDYRALSLIHPLNQLSVVSFYDKFKDSIKYFTSNSEFSIRKPFKVAKHRFTNDYLNKIKKDDEESQGKIELHHKQEEHLKSFFTYKQYSNIHRFFESYEYQRSEKRFNKLYKFDINKCFDSVYTHTIAWALLNKEIVKDNLEPSGSTFAGKFDKLMQNMNYGETNGILIGTEVARIFAEILLQKIDKNVQNELIYEKLIHKSDYRIFRYVDDYFLFYDEEEVKHKIIEVFKHQLKEYNLYISEIKSVEFSKPIITDLTVAKTKITDLVNDEFGYKVLETSEENNKEWTLHLSSKNLITRFKIIVKESNIEYRDILNYSLAIVEKRALKVLYKFKNVADKGVYVNTLNLYLLEMLEFVFFIYSVSPRVSSTIKIVSLISKLLEFLKRKKIVFSVIK
jgi:hypothetical protein